jgi:hypothetical protein
LKSRGKGRELIQFRVADDTLLSLLHLALGAIPRYEETVSADVRLGYLPTKLHGVASHKKRISI